MKFRNQAIKYMSPENDGSDGAANTGQGEEKGKESEFTEEAFKTLQAEKADLLAESMKRKSKIKDLESNTSSMAEKLSQYEGVDVELYTTLMTERATQEEATKAAKEAALISDGKFEELLKSKSTEHEGIISQMNAKHSSELEATGKTVAEIQKQNESLQGQILELTVGSAFGNSKMIREDLISAMTPSRVRQLYGNHFETNEKGEVIGYDKPRGIDGRAPIVDSQGKSVSFDEALKAILTSQDDIDSMLKSKVNGSGSNTNQDNGKGEGGQAIGTGINRISHALNSNK